MKVQITKTSTGKLIATYPIILGSANHSPTEAEYFNEAWQCAVEDKLVVQERQSEYQFDFA